MATAVPPAIFSRARRLAVRRRMLALQAGPDAARYLIADMVEDVIERLAFVRLAPARALILGDFTCALAATLAAGGAEVRSAEPAQGFDEERPYPGPGFDLIATLGTLDTVNDLPGALLHIRRALAPGGMMIASFPGAGSLPRLRRAMFAADGERPAPRIHPQIDVRAGAQLVQRAGFADPVADGRHLDVSFGSLARLVADLRAQGLSNVLARSGPPIGRLGIARARADFTGESGARTVERFEIITLSGWNR
ncbi:MAG: methyltransferase domain-containing protein [Novosphingobium sp.]